MFVAAEERFLEGDPPAEAHAGANVGLLKADLKVRLYEQGRFRPGQT